MEENNTLDRREFTVASIMALLGGITITITGCGGDGPTTSDMPQDETGAISANHGHVAVITIAQLNAGASVRLNIQGTSSHPHTVDVSAVEIVDIRNQIRVSKTSTTEDGHSHTVTFN
ncbi:MAG: hypothetical protein HYX75_23890 [Acidobacteria bacterium]|nr:hypothetical protein [Acidobacteriota bacterium]